MLSGMPRGGGYEHPRSTTCCGAQVAEKTDPDTSGAAGDRLSSSVSPPVFLHYFSTKLPTAISSPQFAELNAKAIAKCNPDFHGKNICVKSYTPPYEGPRSPHGYLEICFINGETKHVVEIVFGSEVEPGMFCRSDFDPEGWSAMKSNPLASNLYAASFDEAWGIVCLVAKYLESTSMSVGYGN